MATPRETESIAKSEKEIVASLEKQIALHNDRLKIVTTVAEKLETQELLEQKLLELEEAQIKLGEKKVEELSEEIEKSEELLANKEELDKLTDKEISNLKVTTQQKRELLEKEKQVTEELRTQYKLKVSLNNVAADSGAMLSKLTGISNKWRNTFVGGLVEANQRGATFGSILSNIGKGVKNTATLSNVLGSTLLKVQEATIMMAIEQDGIVSSFNRAQGAAGAYDDVITDVGQSNLELGIDMQNAAESLTTLKEGFTDFTSLSREAQKELVKFSATMAEFGISNQDTAEIMQVMNKQMGFNTEQSMVAQREMAATAVELGIAPAQMAKDFAKALPRLGAFGKKGTKVFKDLAVAAKATGLEVERLLDITEKFDTFEGAAESVGKLNAILGGGFLDAMTMTMTTDPTERMKMLRQGIIDSGKSFESMSYFERKAIADAAGLANVSELSKLLSGDLEKSAAAAEADALSKEKMAEMAEKAQSIMEKLKSTVHAFAIAMTPVIDAVRWLIESFLWLNKVFGGMLIPAITGFLVLLKLKTIILGASTAATIANTAAKSGAAAAQSILTAVTSAAVGPMLAFGAAVLMVGGGVALAALGIGQMANSFALLDVGQLIALTAVLTLMGAGIIALGIAGTFAGPGLLMVGAAVLMLGGGFLLFATGLSMVISSISGLQGVTSAITEMGKVISELPMTKTMSFMRSFKDMVQVSGQVETTAVNNVERLVEQARIYNEVKEESKTSVVDPFLNMLKSAIGGGGTAAAGAGNQTIVLKLDGRVLDKHIMNVVQENFNPRKK